MTLDTFLEKRKFLRFSLEIPVKFRIIDGSNSDNLSKVLKGIALNLSLGGICLETEVNSSNDLLIYPDQTLGQKNKLEIILILPGDSGKVRTTGEAVWFYFSQQSGQTKFRYGIRFLDIAEKEISKLSEFLEKIKESE